MSHPLSEPQLHSSTPLVFIPKAVSGLGVFISSLVLLGWTFDVPILQSILPGQPQMVPLTAVTFILASVSLGMLKSRVVVSGLCALAVLVIALLIIGEYIGRFDLGLDKIIFSHQLASGDQSFPG